MKIMIYNKSIEQVKDICIEELFKMDFFEQSTFQVKQFSFVSHQPEKNLTNFVTISIDHFKYGVSTFIHCSSFHHEHACFVAAGNIESEIAEAILKRLYPAPSNNIRNFFDDEFFTAMAG